MNRRDAAARSHELMPDALVEQTRPAAVLILPPGTVAQLPLALFPSPPPTVAQLPPAVLFSPPPTVASKLLAVRYVTFGKI